MSALRADRVENRHGGTARTTPARLLQEVAAGSVRLVDLKERPGNCRVIRVYSEDGGSFVLKMWNRPGLRGLIRRLTGTAPHQREAHCLGRLLEHGVRVPEPLGVARVSYSALPYTDALLLEDLGECAVALDHVKRLVREGNTQRLDEFLASVIDLTAGMVAAGVIDRDHSFLNIVAQPDGRPARLDLEIAKGTRSSDAYGEMLGRLVATLIFALQPDASRAASFTNALMKRLEPGRDVMLVAQRIVDDMLEYQRKQGGPDTRIELPWA